MGNQTSSESNIRPLDTEQRVARNLDEAMGNDEIADRAGTEIVLSDGLSMENSPNSPQNLANNELSRYDGEVFVQINKTNTQIERSDGQINGHQFNALQLTRCQVSILDHCSSIMIEKCQDCDFVLSAVSETIFARECINCRFIMVCCQFKCRECSNCDFFLHNKRESVVELSRSIRFGCAEIAYKKLYSHMEQAKIPICNNRWTSVHDLTPGEGNYTLASGEHLVIPHFRVRNSMIPFIYQRNFNTIYFSLSVNQIHWKKLIEVSKNTKIVNLYQEEGYQDIQCHIEYDSTENLRSLFGRVPYQLIIQ